MTKATPKATASKKMKLCFTFEFRYYEDLSSTSFTSGL